MSETEIRTRRLLLRPIVPRDSGLITQLVGDPRIHRMLARVAPGQTKAQTLAWIMTHELGRTSLAQSATGSRRTPGAKASAAKPAPP
jgi:RimJ/RimL family protein N-acetyltransferase